MSAAISELQPGGGEDEKRQEKPTSTEKWLEAFDVRSPIRSASEFTEQAGQRQAEIEGKFPEEALKIRRSVREIFGIGPNDIWVVLGEQPCGLNEPPLVLGKRLLAAYMAKHYGWKTTEYSASSDVVGSEGGMYRVEVPYPHNKSGIRIVNLVSGTILNQSPASQIPAYKVDFERVASDLTMVYGQHSRGLHMILGQMLMAFSPRFGKNQSLAQAQNELLGRLQHRLGLKQRKRVVDMDFDSQIARMGGLKLILDRWNDIIAAANNHSLGDEMTRIPDIEEAPFFTYPDADVEEDVPVRPRIWFADATLRKYVATHPFDKSKILGEFTYDDIINGDVGITFRAIPRVMLLSIVYDAHITGGGAGYNKIASPAFPEVFGASYFPLAWMDLTNESGEEAGVFQYESLALRKRKKGPGYEKAKDLVRQGKVGMLDLAVSLKGDEIDVVNQVLSQDNLPMSQRVDFRKEL